VREGRETSWLDFERADFVLPTRDTWTSGEATPIRDPS